MPRTNYGDDVLELVDRGDIGGMSFGFVVAEERRDLGRRQTNAASPSTCGKFPSCRRGPPIRGTVVNARAKVRSTGQMRGGIRLNLARRYLETLR